MRVHEIIAGFARRRMAVIVGIGLAVLVAIAAFAVLALILFRHHSDDEHYMPAASGAITDGEPVYLFGIHPLHNPQLLFEVYHPLIDYVNARLHGGKLELEASRNYAAYEEKLLKERRFHFALPNPYQSVLATKVGYRVFGQMGDNDLFRGIILVRADSGIKDVPDLKGKVVSYPAPTALAATMMPQYYLHTHGLDVRTDIKNIYVGSQESSIMSVYLGTSAAGATWPVPWNLFEAAHPDIAKLLVVRWTTDTLPNNGLLVRDDVPKAVADQVIELLLTLRNSDEGRRIMARIGVPRFEPANDATYQPVRDFLARYQETIGQVPGQ